MLNTCYTGVHMLYRFSINPVLNMYDIDRTFELQYIYMVEFSYLNLRLVYFENESIGESDLKINLYEITIMHHAQLFFSERRLHMLRIRLHERVVFAIYIDCIISTLFWARGSLPVV